MVGVGDFGKRSQQAHLYQNIKCTRLLSKTNKQTNNNNKKTRKFSEPEKTLLHGGNISCKQTSPPKKNPSAERDFEN